MVEEIKRNDGVAAILYQPYGGQYAGLALGQALFGDYAPTGRLTSTWYADMGALPPLGKHAIPQGPDATVTLERIDPKYSVDMSKNDPIELGLTYMYTAAETSYEFGFGLSYSGFEYSDLSVSEADGVCTVSVKVENVGAVDTSEVVQLYVANPDSVYGAYAPKKRLAAFEKVRIPAGATRTVELSLPVSDIAVWDVDAQRMTVEAGTYAFQVGRSSADIRQTAIVPVAGQRIGPLDLSSTPISVFDHAFAASNVIYRETSKRNTWIGLRDDRVTDGYSAVMSTGPEAWVALPSVDAEGATAVTLRVASPNPRSTIELRRGSPTGEVLGTVGFGPTEPVSFPVPTGDGTGAMLRELGYREVTSALREGGVGGVFDLYLVFDRGEVRVDTIQLGRSGA